MDYFAYASNLSKQQMLQRCPGCKPRFQAVLPHYRLVFSGWSREWKGGTASIIPVRGERVQGAVWDVPEKDVPRLDRCEDYPNTYDKTNVLVLTDTGQAVRAFTYIKRRPAEVSRPSPEYMAVIRQGYKDWGIE
jgi:gamma-glutamylcyclotransferase (GGCT)/AIG2-like uncharacterized protein YtfP